MDERTRKNTYIDGLLKAAELCDLAHDEWLALYNESETKADREREWGGRAAAARVLAAKIRQMAKAEPPDPSLG